MILIITNRNKLILKMSRILATVQDKFTRYDYIKFFVDINYQKHTHIHLRENAIKFYRRFRNRNS